MDVPKDVVIPLVTLVIGYVMKSASDFFESRRNIERDRLAREATRKDKLYERRNEFQRTTLLELQNALTPMMRNAAEMHLHDLHENEKGIGWRRAAYPAEVNADCRILQATVQTLSARLRNDEARSLINEFGKVCWAVGLCTESADSLTTLVRASTLFEQVSLRLGILIRELDDESGI